MQKTILLSYLLFCSLMSIGQDGSFTMNLSSDSILAGNILQVTFVADNLKGEFEGPDLTGLQVISGPNMASSMTMINGDVKQTASYSYSLLLEEIGEITILPAYLNMGEDALETEPVTVQILPNPEGIIEQAPAQSGLFEFNFPGVPSQPKTPSKKKKSAKKKRVLRKI